MDNPLTPHVERMLAAESRRESLSFAPSGTFTHAILQSKDIVSLIRDTDVHERALFTVPTRPTDSNSQPLLGNKRRMSVAPRRNTAVYSVLGGDMIEQLRRGGAGGISGGIGGAPTNDVDVELLLRGAERLTNVYHIPRAAERIESARQRYERLVESITNYEELVEAQQSQLDILGRDHDEAYEIHVRQEEEEITDEMIQQEEYAIQELEQRRAEMEEKIKSLERKANMYRS